MTKTELIALASRYGMSILRDPITGEAWGLALETGEDIPELDAIADDIGSDASVAVTRAYGAYAEAHGTHLYKVICPTEWFDLWGFSGN